MKKQSLVISRVENFIRRIHDGDLVITPKAKNIKLEKVVAQGYLGAKKEQGTLATLMGNCMFEYQSFKDLSATSSYKDDIGHRLGINRRLDTAARELLECIELGYSHGVFKEQKLTSQIKEYQEQNLQLREKVDKLEKENQKLHETLKKFGKAGFVGDVTNDERNSV